MASVIASMSGFADFDVSLSKRRAFAAVVSIVWFDLFVFVFTSWILRFVAFFL